MSIRDWLVEAKAAGLGSIPGTAAEILDDDVRWLLTKGKLPAATWIEVISTAHELGIRSSSTMMYGHVDSPAHWLGHLRTLARVQDQTGGFTEFVALPFIHTNAPIYLAGVARPGPPSARTGSCTRWPASCCTGGSTTSRRRGSSSASTAAATCSRGGVNDLGGTLMEETISRMAGSAHGSAKTVAQLHEIVDGPARTQRAAARHAVRAGERRTARRGRRFTGTLPSLAS